MKQNFFLIKLNKKFIFNYFFNLSIINFLSLLFLYDTDSLNQGLISLQSLFYSINSFLTFFFLILEFTASILQFYGLDHKFLKIIFLDIKSINLLFVYEILITIFYYIIFLVLSCFIIFFRDIIMKKLLNKKFFLSVLNIFIILISINIDFNKKIIDKIYNFNQSFKEYSFFRNDNWFLYYEYNQVVSKKEDFYIKENFINDFSKIIYPNLYNNIFIIINESYPNFKNLKIKNKLFDYINDREVNNDFEIKKYITDWSKEYSTQGAELKLFCGNKSNFIEFKTKNLNDFINNNDCYFKKFDNFHKIFIHTYLKSSFNRNRYVSFFDETFFFKDLKDKELEICQGRPFTAFCDHQLVKKLNEFKINKKNMIIYLTVNNHIPVKLIKNINEEYCNKNYPLNINDQFCFIYQNQILFNMGLNKFIKSLSKDDLLIYYSDTPPIFPIKHRIHFEDYIDVYTFTKK